MKAKKVAKSSDLSQNNMENIQFLSFLPEDFFPEVEGKDSKSKKIASQEELLTHICSQYKLLLELPPLRFWSTLAYNVYLNRSLDSFLSFSQRYYYALGIPLSDEDMILKQELFINANLSPRLLSLFQELYRLVLAIYLRIATECELKKDDSIPFEDVIFDNWIFDLPKFLDICAIFGPSNPAKVRKIVKSIFDIQPNYKEDFIDFLDEVLEGLIPTQLKLINRQRKREDLDAAVIKADTAEREKTLMVLFDVMNNLQNIVDYFPKPILEELFYDKKFILMLENTYMILNSCSKTWKVSEDKKVMLSNLVKSVNGTILNIVQKLFNFAFTEIVKGDFSPNQKYKRIWQQIDQFFSQTGKTALKKKDDQPNFKFLRKLLRYVDFDQCLQRAPSQFIKEDDIQHHQIVLMTVKERNEELKNKKLGIQAPVSEEKEEVVEQPKEQEIVSDKNQPIPELQPTKSQIEDERARNEAIKIVEISLGKTKKAIDIFDDESIREVAKTTLMLAEKTYEDEYDDTLEMYEEDRFKVEGGNDEDEPDDAENYGIEGRLSKEEQENLKGGRRGPGRRNFNDQNEGRDHRNYGNRESNYSNKKHYEKKRPQGSKGPRHENDNQTSHNKEKSYRNDRNYQDSREENKDDQGGYYEQKKGHGYGGYSGGGGDGSYDQKKLNRSAYNESQRHKKQYTKKQQTEVQYVPKKH